MDAEPVEETAPGDDRRYRRSGRGLEFDRVAAFSDAVFSIAMTLLVVGIGVPDVSDGRLGEALRELRPDVVAFFISFVVIGYYWLGHHRLVSLLDEVDNGFMVLNLLYLATIAFLPFPTALVPEFQEDALAVVLYAVTLGAASLMELALFWWCWRRRLFRTHVPGPVFRWALVASGVPVLVFAVSVPLAYVDSQVALLSWLLIFPVERVVDHFRPSSADLLG